MENREPCPGRIADDMGGAFAMGLIGGSIFSGISGLRNAPKIGWSSRFLAAGREVRVRAPSYGGAFAAWGGVFSTCDCTLGFLRGKEDPWNSIISGATTGGLLVARQGVRAITLSAFTGAVVLAMIEGVGLAMTRHAGSIMNPVDAMQLPMPDPAALGNKIQSSSTGSSDSIMGNEGYQFS